MLKKQNIINILLNKRLIKYKLFRKSYSSSRRNVFTQSYVLCNMMTYDVGAQNANVRYADQIVSTTQVQVSFPTALRPR
jgi:hypothetical protein